MGFAEGFSAGANARNTRDALRQQAEQRNQELMAKGYDFSNGQMTVRENSAAQGEQLAAKEATLRAKAVMGRVFKDETARAHEDRILSGGDASYIDRDINSSPEKKAAYAQKGIQNVANIDFENDTSILSRAGITSTMYDTPEKRAILKKNLYKGYNGKDWGLLLGNQEMIESGAFKTLGPRRAAPAVESHKELVSLLSGPKVSPDTAEGHKYEREINSAAEKYNLPPDLIVAMMATESNNNPNAISTVRGKDYTGLMQVGEAAAKDVGIADRNASPEANIMAGAGYMRKMLDKYGDVKLALAAYNAGPEKVDKYGGIPPYGETQNYVQKITARLDNGGQYYGRTSQDVYDRMMEHDRRTALAAQGKTPEQADAESASAIKVADAKVANLPLENLKTVAEIDKLQSDVKEAPLKRDLDERTLKVREQEARVKLLTEGSTTTSKDLNTAARITDELVTKYGDEEKFFKQTEFDAKDKVKALEIMELRTGGLSEADKTNITEISQLISLGSDVANLDKNDTGIVDNILGNVKAYYSDNVKGKEAKASYNTFKNVFRKALFGATLTTTEKSSFAEAYGALGMQAGPVLEMFKTSFAQVGVRLDSVKSTMDPYSAQVILGGQTANVAKTIKDLEAKIESLNAGTYTPSEIADKLFEPMPQNKTANKSSLDDILYKD